MKINSRASWKFPGWASPPFTVGDKDRTEFVVHYEGGTPTRDTGGAAMRSIDRVHRDKGWSGIGYNFVVMQDGTAWEGRGWNLVGAHCPDHNRSGVGVQIHIGGSQKPTAAALRTARALYDEACKRSERKLRIMGHQDGYATECPGKTLEAWVRASLPITEDDMPLTDADVAKIWAAKIPDRHLGATGATAAAADVLSFAARWSYMGIDATRALGASLSVEALAEALAARLPTMAPADVQAIAAGVAEDIAKRLAE